MSVNTDNPDADSKRSSQEVEETITTIGGNLHLEKVDTEPGIPPTDIGLQPWLQVVAGFFLMFNAWGIILSWGTFQSYYTTGGMKGDMSESSIAWIGSVQAFLLLFGGAVSGKYFDAGYFRQMLLLGTFMIVFGLMMTSLATEYYQVLLAQGLCVGSGTGMLLVPSVGLPSTWFLKRRGLATGIVSTGASVAGIVLPIGLRHLIPLVGFGWATRILGFISLLTLSIGGVLIRQRLEPRPRGSFVEYKALRQREFVLYITGISVTFLGFYAYYDFVEAWATATDVDMHGLDVVYLLPMVNATSVFGRIIPMFMADYIGPLNTQAPCLLFSALVVLAWIPVRTLAPLVVISILYGFFSGGVMACPPMAIASMTEDLRTFGGRMGVMFLGLGGASLGGPPITGAIIQSGPDNYDGGRIFAGVTMIAGGSLIVLSRMTKSKWVIREKA